MQIHKILVKNREIDILYKFDKSLPIVKFELVFKASGSVRENIDGLAKLSANLLNEGTKTLGVNEFTKLLDIKAISLFVYSEFEKITISISCLKEHFKFGLKMLTDLLKDPNLTDETLEKLKIQTLGEIAMLKSEFDYVSQMNLFKTLYKGTKLANDIQGTQESIAKITLSDVKEFLSGLCLENLFAVLCGDTEFCEREIKELLEILPNGEKMDFPCLMPTTNGEISEIYEDSEQAYIYFGSPFNVDINEEYLAKTALFVLGSSGFGSRLMEEIRVKRGLAYSVYVMPMFSLSRKNLFGYLQTKNESKDEAIAIVKEEITKFVNDGISLDELEAAKKFMLGSAVLRKETIFQRLSILQDEYYRGFKFGEFERNLEKIKNINLDDLNKFIKTHSEICNLTFSIVCKK